MLPLVPMVQVNCKLCAKEFYAKPSWIKKGHGVYCSATCHHKDARTGKIVCCAICKKKVYKSQKALNGSKSGKFFCSKSCQTIWRNSEYIQERHPNWKDGRYSYRGVIKRNNIKPLCTLCNTTDKRVLAVHHVDENRTNNTIENLAWLCHNCHHLVHHHPEEHKRFMAIIV